MVMKLDGCEVAFHGMVGRSRVMCRVFECIQRIAALSATVLLVGESGTGKELAARAIHQAGPCQAKPFVPVNCAALPHDLIESELFGHKRGAFSGATTDHPGLFRAAAGGVLFLDEITEMKPGVQAKLLRALEDRSVRPVGSLTEIPVDARVIASSNRDPETALAQGLLRQDLYYRLAVHTIRLPPLREHLGDVPVLVDHHIRRMKARDGGVPFAVTPEALDWLRCQPWPGNVRELFNALEGATALSSSPNIGVEAFLCARSGLAPIPLSERAPMGATPPAQDGQVLTLKDGERALIRRALEASGGNRRHAAQVLGISRKTLYKKLADHALHAPKAKPARRLFLLPAASK
jgi:DNA-binding NtrC family response regulator